MQVEDWVDLILCVRKLASVDSVQDGTGVFEGATLATSGSTRTDPAGVQEPGIGLVLLHLLSEHGSIAHWVEGKEWLSETCRECSLGLGDANFSTGHLGSVAGDEVEHHLLGSELGNGR